MLLRTTGDQAGRALCTVAALLCVLLASNIPVGEAAVGAPTQTLRFAATISDTPGPRHSPYPTPLNASATGVRLGDYIAFNNDLADLTNISDPGPGNRTVIGLDSGYCVVTSEPPANATSIPLNCFETLLFTEGPYANSSLSLNIVVGYGSPASAPHAVTGGSGQFVGATGQVVLSNTPYAANTTAGDMYFDVTLY